MKHGKYGCGKERTPKGNSTYTHINFIFSIVLYSTYKYTHTNSEYEYMKSAFMLS